MAARAPNPWIASCTWLALLASSAGARTAPRVVFPSERPDWDPAPVRALLAAADSAVVARAMGGARLPWFYRGRHFGESAHRIVGLRGADSAWAREFAGLLLRGGDIDSTHLAPRLAGEEQATDRPPMYVVDVMGGGSSIRALVRFDAGYTVFYVPGRALGFAPMGERADSLWARLHEVLDWDTLLAAPRPAPAPLAPRHRPRAPGFGGGADVAPPPPAEDEIDVLPEAIRKVPPVYPTFARDDGLEGTVWIQALVGDDGAVKDAVAFDGPGELFDAALDAVWQWKFKPARAAGKPLPVWVALPCKFTLD